jgi:cellobiose-specific phosphotransferase system component IIC
VPFLDEDVTFLALMPGLVVFALGLSITVAPLTAAVLADADEHNAGIASGVNNAVARVAGLLAIAAVGAVAGGRLDVDSMRTVLVSVAVLLVLGGVCGFAGIRNAPRRETRAAECPGGQLAGAPRDAAYAMAGAGNGNGAEASAKRGGAISR